ncbi:AraC family transcriptional regulator [Spartinivicinus poritis]|uniref:Helix-turn-helix transcriptional regulator n=1 Tax=Spartinivicinus poritis TaxID=2994640 RepID=A0ABT5U5L3_9GAMM|nr:helix-turn-helix transcriptional regulator [Spartinivicinus sp. A2-2]MDE1461648.1 helix-turn-helix transcriptional regulator [Spartinivicinus sp. A2-2]
MSRQSSVSTSICKKMQWLVEPRSVDMPPKHFVASHQHPWGQFLFAVEGLICVKTEAGTFLVPPQQGVWVPSYTDHEIFTLSGAKFRSLYIAKRCSEKLNRPTSVIQVTALLREVILAITNIPVKGKPDSVTKHLWLVLYDCLKSAESVPLNLPVPQDSRLTKLVNRLLQHPTDSQSLEAWGVQLGASARTIRRIFLNQTQMSFSEWKQRLKVLKAIELMIAGMTVTEVAFELKYESSAAFINMFKRQMGLSPKSYLARMFH